jgi:DNA-binding GntR family transcriptional regulator
MSGARVTTLVLKDVVEISEARVALETSAARLVASRLSAISLVETQKTLKRLAVAVRTRRWVSIVNADADFHRSIITATQNGRLFHFWQLLDSQLRLYLSYRAPEAYELTGSLVDAHEALFKAIHTGYPDQAAQAFASHIMERTSKRLELWKQAPSFVGRDVKDTG